MSSAEKQRAIDELIEKSSGAIYRRSFFEAERMSLKAVQIARQIEDFERMILAVEPLRTARSERLKVALTARKVTVVSDAITEGMKIGLGCYLVEPPQVGADARRLRLTALQNDVPVAVLCREPLTKLKQWPIVAIGAGMTVRTRIAPPKTPSKPDMKWFAGALEQLGEWAVQTIDPTVEPLRRLDVVLERLDTIPDCAGLHDLLVRTCQEVLDCHKASSKLEPGRKRGRRAKLPS